MIILLYRDNYYNDLDPKNAEKIIELYVNQHYSTSEIIDKYKYLLIIGIEHRLVPIWQIKKFKNVNLSLSRVASKDIYAFQFIVINPNYITYNNIDVSTWTDPNIELYGIY